MQVRRRDFDQRADAHICTDVCGFDRLGEFAVAVIHHADDVRLDAFEKSDQLADLLYAQGRSGLIALGSLDRCEFSIRMDGVSNALPVK